MIRRIQIVQALAKVQDPELGADIVNLGLIYDIHKIGSTWVITMTLTFPGCPLVEVFRNQISDELLRVGLKKHRLIFSFTPAWTPAMIEPDLRLALSI